MCWKRGGEGKGRMLSGGNIRKLIVVVEELHSVATRTLPSGSARKVLAAAVITNPLVNSTRVDDKLDGLIDLGAEAGAVLGERAVAALDMPVVSYGKAVIVGTRGQLEHGAALLHPKFGATVRAAIGHGVDIMPSTKKVAAPGTGIDVPLHNKDNVWSFPEVCRC